MRAIKLQWCKFTDISTQTRFDNRLIGGNRDNGGLKAVNDWQSDNHNDNIAFRLQIVLYPLVVLIQPPSILPISMVSDVSCWYLLLSRHFVSCESRRSIFKRSSLMLAFWSIGNFCSLDKYPAVITSSMISRVTWSILWPRVYLFALGKLLKYWFNSL